MKAIIAAPPDVLRVDEKHLREYSIPNVCGVIITTNHKTDGIYLPADDRRHYVAWSDLTKDDFEAEYWTKLWRWYDQGGDRHVAAYLASLDLAGFDPEGTAAQDPRLLGHRRRQPRPRGRRTGRRDRRARAEASRPQGDPGSPVAFTLAAVLDKAIALAPKDKDGKPERSSFAAWLADRSNRRQIPHRFEQCGYSPVRNDAAKDGLWKVGDARQVIYALACRSLRDRLAAAKLVRDSDAPVLELYVPVDEVGEVSGPPLSSPRVRARSFWNGRWAQSGAERR